MNRRSIFAVLLFCAVSAPVHAWAQGNGNNGKGKGENSGNGGNGNSGNGNGGGNGNNGNGNNGNGNADERAPASRPGELSDSDAVAAVETGKAVSLETILPDLRSRTGGELIEAKLQQTKGFLLYAVTVLTPEGQVVTEYYYARSGLHVDR